MEKRQAREREKLLNPKTPQSGIVDNNNAHKTRSLRNRSHLSYDVGPIKAIFCSANTEISIAFYFYLSCQV